MPSFFLEFQFKQANLVTTGLLIMAEKKMRGTASGHRRGKNLGLAIYLDVFVWGCRLVLGLNCVIDIHALQEKSLYLLQWLDYWQRSR